MLSCCPFFVFLAPCLFFSYLVLLCVLSGSDVTPNDDGSWSYLHNSDDKEIQRGYKGSSCNHSWLETSNKLSVRERMCISNFWCDCTTCINSKIYFIWLPLKISQNFFVFVSGSSLGVAFAFALNLRISIRQMKTSRGWVVSCGSRRLFIRFPDTNSRLRRRNFLCEVSTVVV